MATFKDKTGRSWSVEINGFTMKQMKSQLDFNVCSVVEKNSQSLVMLLQDIERTIDCIWLCCEEQAVSRNVSDVQFGQALAGDCLNDAIDAFLKAIIDFFPNPKQRETLAALFQAGTTAGEMVLGNATADLKKLNETLTNFTGSFSNAQPSETSTPGKPVTAK